MSEVCLLFLPLWDFLMRFFALCFLILFISDVLVRLYMFCCIIFCWFSMRDFMRSCCYEMSLWNLSRFAAYFYDEISLWDVMLFGRNEMSLLDFMLFAAQFSYEISLRFFMPFFGHYELCVWDLMLGWPLLKRCGDELSCFLAADFWLCNVRTAERWMLKDSEDWVHTMVHWCAS
jgi:hypothetical protein